MKAATEADINMPALPGDLVQAHVGDKDTGEIQARISAVFYADAINSQMRYNAHWMVTEAARLMQTCLERQQPEQETLVQKKRTRRRRLKRSGELEIPEVCVTASQVVTWMLLIISGLMVETFNLATSIAARAMTGFDTFFTALPLALPVVLIPFVSLKFAYAVLDETERRQFTRRAAVPLLLCVLAFIVLTCWTTGHAAGSEDVYASGESQSAWLLVLGANVLGAVAVAICSINFASCLDYFFTDDVEGSAEVAEATAHYQAIENVRLDASEIHSCGKEVLKRLAETERVFIDNALAALKIERDAVNKQQQKENLAAQISALNAKATSLES